MLEKITATARRLAKSRLAWIGLGAIVLSLGFMIAADATDSNLGCAIILPFLALMIGLPTLLVATVAAWQGHRF